MSLGSRENWGIGMGSTHVQGSFFEQEYLVRTLGTVASVPDVALTELVANAWDAGATKVEIVLPEESEGVLKVVDDGCGLSAAQFKERWMTLGYNRARRQGSYAEFPPERKDWKRRAYGRNGIGRHGMLCFADQYLVETSRNGSGHKFHVAAVAGPEPFALLSESSIEPWDHGTRLITSAIRNIPQASRIRDVLAGRFLHDPQFKVYVNGETVDLSEHEGLVDQHIINLEGVTLDIVVVDSNKTAKRVRHHGVAYWVGGRLVGEPSWIVGNRVLADGRTAIARRHTIVVRTEDLFDEVEPDWSAFKKSDKMSMVHGAVADYIDKLINRLSAERLDETRATVLKRHRAEISRLRPLAKRDIEKFVSTVTQKRPSISSDLLAAAVEAVIALEKSRSGVELLQKLSLLDKSDVEGLNRLLDDWTVRDALTVLDEIDRRIAVVEALDRLSGEEHADELNTLHPLITQARWLFGPEYDSPLYASNTTLRKAAQVVFKKQIRQDTFINAAKRPDLLVVRDATLSIVGADEIAEDGLSSMRGILILELKRGASVIGREEMNQAKGYVEDLQYSGLIEGTPFVRAFVIGHRVNTKSSSTLRVGEPETGRIEACTFGRLVRTANARLLRLRDELSARYGDAETTDLVSRAGGESAQQSLPLQPGAA